EDDKTDESNKPLTFESKASAKLDDEKKSFSKEEKPLFQIHNTYIISQVKSGFMLIDQQAAHERILFEKYLKPISKEETNTQKELFSRTFTFSPSDAAILRGMLEDLNLLGFDIRELGTEAFVIHGVPTGLPKGINEQELIESILEQHKMNLDVTNSVQEIIAMSLARRSSIKKGQVLQQKEMQEIIDQLFACSSPMVSPSGKKIFLMLEMEEILRRFGA
ncbi:MAG: DNA mismatch repair protein MutL, partial [Saprospiraceae bacterium]